MGSSDGVYVLSTSEWLYEQSGLKTAIELMQLNLKLQYDGMDSLKATARSLLTASTIVIAVLGALQIFGAVPAPGWKLTYGYGAGLVMILYLVEIGLCISALFPSQVYAPVVADWDTFYNTFMDLEPVKADQMLLATYLNAHKLNVPVLEQVLKRLKAANVLLPVLILLILLLSIIPRTI